MEDCRFSVFECWSGKKTESEQEIKVSVSSGIVVMDKGQGPDQGREINPSISRLMAERNKMDSMSKAG